MSQQQKKKIALVAIISAAIVAGSVAYLYPAQATITEIPMTQEEKERNEALGVAQRYVVTSPTFAFDGDINTLDTLSIDTLESFPVQYKIRMSFDSSHAGFGDREGQMLAQVITPHTIEIIVSEGEVISAVTDGTWDEQNHQYVLKPNPKLPSSDIGSSTLAGVVMDYESLVAALKSRGLAVELKEEMDDSIFGVPLKVISAGGIDMQIYEFASEEHVQSAKETVSSDGTEIGLSIIRWMDVPHFYSQGTIIVQYIGHNPEITSLLDSLLGNQFAGM